MKASRSRSLPFQLPSLSGWRRLLLPVLLALAVNLLLFLPAVRPPEPQATLRAPAPPDNTPELLRFSRQQAQQPALSLLPFPSLADLPPPPPADLPGGRSPGASGSPGDAADGAARTRTPQAAAAESSAAGAKERGSASRSAEAPVARLLAMALKARPVEGAEASSLAALWEQATPSREPPAGLAAPPEGVELRRLPLAKARSAELTLSEPFAVLSAGRLLLLWPEGSDLWMLGSAGGGGAESPSS